MRLALSQSTLRTTLAVAFVFLTLLASTGDLLLPEPVLESLKTLALESSGAPPGGMWLMTVLAFSAILLTLGVAVLAWLNQQSVRVALIAWWGVALLSGWIYTPVVVGPIESIASDLLCGVAGALTLLAFSDRKDY